MKSPTEFNSLLDLVKCFDTEQKCLDYIAHLRWGNEPTCITCFSNKVWKFKDGKRYKCGECKEEYTVKVGTIFQDSKLPLIKWFMAMHLICHNKGISSYDLADDLDVTQKTSWILLTKIRKLLEQDDTIILSGTVQVDESFVGGKNKNRHKAKKVENSQGRSFKDKTPVMGMVVPNQTETIVREHKVIKGKMVEETRITKKSFAKCTVITDTQAETLQYIKKG